MRRLIEEDNASQRLVRARLDRNCFHRLYLFKPRQSTSASLHVNKLFRSKVTSAIHFARNGVYPTTTKFHRRAYASVRRAVKTIYDLYKLVSKQLG